MLRIAFALWQRRNRALLGEILHALDAANLRAVGELLIAIAGGPTTIDGWIRRERLLRDDPGPRDPPAWRELGLDL